MLSLGESPAAALFSLPFAEKGNETMKIDKTLSHANASHAVSYEVAEPSWRGQAHWFFCGSLEDAQEIALRKVKGGHINVQVWKRCETKVTLTISEDIGGE